MRWSRLAPAWMLFCLSASVAAAPPTPLPDGAYQFRWKDAEFPNSTGFPVRVEIAGTEIRVVKENSEGPAPVGELERATLMWHSKSGKWILGSDETDSLAPSVGGCGDGDPHVIDFETREIWTCEWGP